tara:strand:+ start:414 stop:767 length:354 start_codon:yes stop_codon:yes gene_type:complete
MALVNEDHYFPIDLLNDPAEAADGPIDVLDFPSGGNYRKGSDVLDQMIQLERVQKPTKGKEFLNSFLTAQNPSFDIGAGHRGVSRNAKIHNLTRNNPNLKEVEAAKQMLGGVRLPTF